MKHRHSYEAYGTAQRIHSLTPKAAPTATATAAEAEAKPPSLPTRKRDKAKPKAAK